MKNLNWSYLIIFILLGCNSTTPNDKSLIPTPKLPEVSFEKNWNNDLTKEVYYDKVLGALVGSAIGDAMGGPTEMWHKSYIQQQYGYVDALETLVREGSAEGPWADNLPAGGTTDDTRWKYLVSNFLILQGKHKDSLDPKSFAKYLVDTYTKEKDSIKQIESFDPEPLEKQMMKMNFLQEWAKVAKPYYENDLDKYSYAVSKFYGGEMVCGGMLYAPVIGIYYPSSPQKAYMEAYRLGFFDIGYGRDITGLTAAMVAAGMKPNATLEEIEKVNVEIDPLKYFNSRLTGRMSYRNFTDAKSIVFSANQIEATDIKKATSMPKKFNGDALQYARMQKAFELLEAKSQDMPFHSAEIHLINLTAIMFSEGDFKKALEFVVNYGRDNDTVGAVTGSILGAFYGYKKLPKSMAEKALKTNKEVIGIDLELLAKGIVETKFN